MRGKKSAASAKREELALSGANVADADKAQLKAINKMSQLESSTAAEKIVGQHKGDLTRLKQQLLEKQKGNALAMLTTFSDATVEAANYLLRVVRGDYGEDVNHRIRVDASKIVLQHFPPEMAVKLAGLDAMQGKDLSAMTPGELVQFIELGKQAVQHLRQSQGTVTTYEAVDSQSIKDLE